MLGGLGVFGMLFGMLIWILPLILVVYLIQLISRAVTAIERIATAMEHRP